MSREKKAQIINGLQEAFAKSNVSILTDYRGLATSEMTTIRRKLQESQSEYKVVKNTLARLAAEKAGKEALVNSLQGPIAIAFGYGEITAPAKALANYIKDAKSSLKIKAGLLGDRLITSQEVMVLATLPSREILLARVFGQMKSPISALLSGLTAPMRGLIGVLQARIKQVEGK